MNVTILAANGQIARLVEERLLTEPIFKDVQLTLMLRHPERLSELNDNPRVTLLDGDLTNPTDVIQATKDADLIWLAVVNHNQSNRPTKNIIAATKQNGVERVVETSLLGLYNEVPGEFGDWNRDYCFNGDPTGTTAALADQLLAEAGLTYTTLRLPWLNDRPEVNHTLTHRHDQFAEVSGSRRSIADVVCRIIADPSLGANDSLGIGDPTTEGATRPVY